MPLERFNEIPGWYRHEPFFKWWVNGQAPEVSRVAEVGVLFGAGSHGLSELIAASGKRITHVIVDLFDDSMMGVLAKEVMLPGETHREAFERYRRGRAHENAQVVVMDTLHGKTPLPPFNLVFLDTKHTYGHVSMEMLVWWPRVVPGGILAVKVAGVKNGKYETHEGGDAVRDFARAQGVKRETFDEFVMFVRKPE